MPVNDEFGLYLCIVSATRELFEDAVKHATQNATGALEVVFGYGNGVDLDGVAAPVAVETRRTRENRGVVAALHELYEMAYATPGATPNDVLCYIHDDVRILDRGWDQRVKAAFARDETLGLAGFGGSSGIGSHTIYREPYNPGQLGRIDFYSNMLGAEAHGIRTTEERPIVYTDGQSMIVRRGLLDQVDGWSWWPFDLVHHAYDYGIACMARRHGYSGLLIPCAMEHRGGMTACGPAYKELAAKHGGDAAVHDASHRFVYQEFRDVLPLRLP